MRPSVQTPVVLFTHALLRCIVSVPQLAVIDCRWLPFSTIVYYCRKVCSLATLTLSTVAFIYFLVVLLLFFFGLVGAYTGAHADARDAHGQNFLHHAAVANGRVGAVRVAVQLGLDINARTRLGETALLLTTEPTSHWFSKSDPRCFTDFAGALLRHGADISAPNLKAARGREQPIHVAVRRGAVDCVAFLLKNGANVNAASAVGSPLKMAARINNPAIVQVRMHARCS